MLTISHQLNGESVTASIQGHVDSSNAAELEAQLSMADTAKRLILDVEELEYISSAGLRTILKFRKKHPDLEIVNASTEVYEILDMTGFTEMMSVKRAYRSVSVEGCEVIGEGAKGRVYRIDPDTVVKVYFDSDSLGAIEHEREVARKALVLGIPTAISYDVVKVDGCYASMFEMVNAASFSELLADHPEDVDRYAAMFVDMLKLIHATEVPAGQLPSRKEYVKGRVKYAESVLPQEVFAKLWELIEAVPETNGMIHGDYHTKNLMLQNDEVILIDMDTLSVGHPIFELSSIYMSFVGHYLLDHDAFKAFLGFDYDIGMRMWQDILRLYYDGEDEEKLAVREKQITLLGDAMLLGRSVLKTTGQRFVDLYAAEVCRLLPQVDTLL